MSRAPLHVLLVDDDPVLLRSLARSLSALGLDVLTAGCAAEANAVLQHEAIDVVVSDHKMHGTQGLPFLEGALARHPDLRGILLSGEVGDLPVAERWARQMGVKLLKKPCPTDLLAETIRLMRAASTESSSAAPTA